jgi:hypothetical protein
MQYPVASVIAVNMNPRLVLKSVLLRGGYTFSLWLAASVNVLQCVSLVLALVLCSVRCLR